jgi:Bacteriophage minor capsid protein
MSLSLLNSPAEVIRAVIIALELGVVASYDSSGVYNGGNWPVFVDGEPSSPDNCVTVYDTAWRSDGRAMVTGETWHHYGFQVRIRSTTSNIGLVQADAIHRAFDELVNQMVIPISPATYLVPAISGTNLLRLGKDTPRTKRSLFTVNGLTPILRIS